MKPAALKGVAMKIIACEQGTVEWLQAKSGIPSASEFHKIITTTGKLSKQSRDYAYRLVAERLLGRTLVDLDYLDAIAQGKRLEPEAIRLYEFDRGVDTFRVGFVTTDDGRIGASPDRFVGEHGLLEVKAPLPQTHVGYLLDGFCGDYHTQRQGQLLVTEREFLDMMSYSPELPPRIERYTRDEPFIRLMCDALGRFCDALDDMRERARSSGLIPYTEPKRPKPEQPQAPSLGEQIRLNEIGMRMHAP